VDSVQNFVNVTAFGVDVNHYGLGSKNASYVYKNRRNLIINIFTAYQRARWIIYIKKRGSGSPCMGCHNNDESSTERFL